MIFAGLALLLAAAAPAQATDEAFRVGPAEINGPCHVTIAGKPSEDPPRDCAAAIAAAPTAKQKAIFYFAWAYSLNEVNATLQALPNLDKAVALAPNFRNARHERAYTLSDLGYYDKAIIDNDRDVALSPEAADAYTERAFTRHRLADFAGALADRLKAATLDGTNDDRETGIIDELMWLARYDEAARRLQALTPTDSDRKRIAELDRRRQFKPDGGETKRCILEQNVADRVIAQKLVDDCTWAFDHETDPIKRANFLTARRVMTVVALQEADAGVFDLQVAAALDARNPERHINLGNALVGVRHSWAARNEFDTALAAPGISKRDRALALAGRGRARMNLGDLDGAFSDEKASFALEPSRANVLLGGDIAFAKGDKALAKNFWMVLYRMGVRDDSLFESLKSVGVDDPAKEPRPQ